MEKRRYKKIENNIVKNRGSSFKGLKLKIVKKPLKSGP